MNVTLVMFKVDGTRRDFPITRGRVVIGRKNNCDLRIPLSSVSRQHCEISVNGSDVALRDMGSSNGTFVNDNRVKETLLNAGDEITIGPVSFVIVIDGQPHDIKPVKTVVTTGSTAHTSAADPADNTTAGGNSGLDEQIAALDAMANNDSDMLNIDDEIDLSQLDLDE